jgi:hypothetical protein
MVNLNRSSVRFVATVVANGRGLCITYPVYRWFHVANLTLYCWAII